MFMSHEIIHSWLPASQCLYDQSSEHAHPRPPQIPKRKNTRSNLYLSMPMKACRFQGTPPSLHFPRTGDKEAANARWAATARMPTATQDSGNVGTRPKDGRHARRARARKQANEVGSFRCPAVRNFDAKHYRAARVPC